MHEFYTKQLRYVDLTARINYGRAASSARATSFWTHVWISLEGGEGDERLHISAACRRPGSDAYPGRGGCRVVRFGALFLLCTLLPDSMPHCDENSALR